MAVPSFQTQIAAWLLTWVGSFLGDWCVALIERGTGLLVCGDAAEQTRQDHGMWLCQAFKPKSPRGF